MESLTNWCVYMHTHKRTGRKYIGMTGSRPTRKWANGKLYREECPAFYAAIKTYGWDEFKHEIVYTDLTLKEAEIICHSLIEKYNTTDPFYGYNLAKG